MPPSVRLRADGRTVSLWSLVVILRLDQANCHNLAASIRLELKLGIKPVRLLGRCRTEVTGWVVRLREWQSFEEGRPSLDRNPSGRREINRRK